MPDDDRSASPRLLISLDGGVRWRPMARGFQQSGRILRTDGDIVVQSAGRGAEVWYRLAENDAPLDE